MSISTLIDRLEIGSVPRLAPRTKSVSVSVIIPCFNEERFIRKALEGLADQYELDSYEIVIVDGMSTDGTRNAIREFQETNPQVRVRVFDNPQRSIPVSLNIGIAAARGEVVARIDAHAAPSKGYIRRCVEVLNRSDVQVVGMPCRVQPGANTRIAYAIASAVSHPFGIGDATYRLTTGDLAERDVDTVAFACFRKSLWAKLGGYDERLLTNEDYDFNYRAHRVGRVVLDGAEHCDYFARTTFKGLASQYWRYGSWKARMVVRQPRSIKLRHLVAPLFASSLFLLAVGGLMSTFAQQFLAIEFALYLTASFAAAVHVGLRDGRDALTIAMLPLVFFTIHICWGTSFLFGLIHRR